MLLLPLCLVQECVEFVPVDYVDGQPMRYRLNADGSFVLYSVGEDANDDGGDTALRTDGTNLRNLWERNDFVRPNEASAEETETYRNESPKMREGRVPADCTSFALNRSRPSVVENGLALALIRWRWLLFATGHGNEIPIR
jgi:hypothetical protein